MPTFTPQQYAARDRLVLDMAGLFRLIIPRCFAEILSDGKPLTHALNRLTADQELTRHERCLPGGLTAYTLTPRAAARRGVPRDRAELPAGAALDAAIAIQTFCCLGPHRRHRLDHDQAVTLLPSGVAPNIPLILSDELGAVKVFRAVLAVNRHPTETVRHLRTLVDQASRHASLAGWVSEGQLGFALLAPTPQAEAALEKAVVRSQLRRNAPVIVGLGPGAEHLAAVLKHGEGAQPCQSR